MDEDDNFPSINELPDEILEFILILVSPYKDLISCKLVCRRWNNLVKRVVVQQKLNFDRAVSSMNVQWESVPVLADPYRTISRRYSHSSCYYNDCLYVFGGCTATNTTFNDLWKLDLTTREWVRPIPVGCYPSPKACATLLPYKDKLILYGGWARQTSATPFQPSRVFGELNIYCPKTNRWDADFDFGRQPPPAAAAHSATIHDNFMVTFGGMRGTGFFASPSSDLVVYDLEKEQWKICKTSEPRPHPRYGQTQISLSNKHIVIIGGCGGANKVFSDAWLLTMEGPVWQWTELRVENLLHAAPHMWCSPGCLVEDKVVFLGKRSQPVGGLTDPSYNSHYNISAQIRAPPLVWVPPVQQIGPQQRNNERDEGDPAAEELNVNGRKGSLRRRRDNEGSSSGEEVNPGHRDMPQGRPRPASLPSVRPNAMRDRERQMESLRRMERRLDLLRREAQVKSRREVDRLKQPANTMNLFVLDVSSVLSDHKVSWLPPGGSVPRNAPEEAVLYSISKGNAELIVFGGVQKFVRTEITNVNENNSGPNVVSNAVYFIKPPKCIV